MKNLIQSFPTHLQEALQIIERTTLQAPDKPIKQVVITGLGGSGIGGSIVADLAEAAATVPVWVNKGYQLPGFVNENTLLIACSYSGNTEETLQAFEEAVRRKALIACITSGGTLAQRIKELNLNSLQMEGGNPPRSMLGFSLTFLCHLLEFYKIVDLKAHATIKESMALLQKNQEEIMHQGEELARKLAGKICALYAADGLGGVAARCRQQWNENSKMLAWDGVVPEMNHNELVGWEGGSAHYAALFLRSEYEYSRNAKRIEINKQIIASKTIHCHEIWGKGGSILAQALYLIHYGDWISYYLSEINQVDILDISSIDFLKSELSKIPR